MFRVGTPLPFLFRNWTQWCMTVLNLTPHFKYITTLCCHNSYIIILDRPTRNRSVHKNDQHVQGWNPTIIIIFNCFCFFFKIEKIDLKSILMYVVGFFCKTSVYIRISMYLAPKSWALRRNKMEICIFRKIRKIDSYKTVSRLTIEPWFFKLFFSSQHNSNNEMCRALFLKENERKIGWDNWLTTL